jgi:hypothetical protein
MTRAFPRDVARQLVVRIGRAALDQAFREAERHRRVVGPFAGFEVEGAAADHVGDRSKAARRGELERRPQGVAGRKSEHRPAVAVKARERLNHDSSSNLGADVTRMVACHSRGILRQQRPPCTADWSYGPVTSDDVAPPALQRGQVPLNFPRTGKINGTCPLCCRTAYRARKVGRVVRAIVRPAPSRTPARSPRAAGLTAGGPAVVSAHPSSSRTAGSRRTSRAPCRRSGR